MSSDGLPTPRSTLRDDSARVLRYRCSRCRSQLTDWVVTSRYSRRPTWNRDGSA